MYCRKYYSTIEFDRTRFTDAAITVAQIADPSMQRRIEQNNVISLRILAQTRRFWGKPQSALWTLCRKWFLKHSSSTLPCWRKWQSPWKTCVLTSTVTRKISFNIIDSIRINPKEIRQLRNVSICDMWSNRVGPANLGARTWILTAPRKVLRSNAWTVRTWRWCPCCSGNVLFQSNSAFKMFVRFYWSQLFARHSRR